MNLPIPTLEDHQRLEAKIDRLLKLLDRPVAAAPVDVTDKIERKVLLVKLGICKTTLLKLERQGYFTPVHRGRKTYYTKAELVAYLERQSYKPEAVLRIAG
jgi:hypothetical protein